ncbi:MAG TPA: molybdopterin-dependent oxidoreductase [Burkholderiales bacterium]|nr:molybdopterin-dependent oxidoreductase [Burkholderiales bacterium]
MPETRSTCCYCGVGCGVIVETEQRPQGAAITGVRGDPAHPANFGKLCTKGSTLHLTAGAAGRLLYPQLRPRGGPERPRDSRDSQGRRGGTVRMHWDGALALAAERFGRVIREHGPDAVAFYISGQLLTEDYYVFNKLAKGLIGTNNVDTNSRLCMSSAVAGYKATLGSDAPPACYEDIDHAQCLFIAGSNTAWAHPILYRRIEAARARNPGLKMIVVDPRRTDTARDADLHLAILPGTDVALCHAMLHVLLWEGLCDMDYIRAHTEGFDALRDKVREFTPALAAEICGVAAADIVTAAKWFGQSRATLSLYCQGLNQSANGTHNNAALINLHLATGHIGRPGAGPFSLTGQPNAMGGREVGGMANLLPAHRDLADPAHRAEVAALWGVDSLPARPGKTAVELFQALRLGEVRAVWIACTNPAQSMPDATLVRSALARAEFVVLQDCYAHTDTAAFADLLLPASTWGEKDGTVTNSERRITRVRAAVPPPGEARHDWVIARDFALALGRELGSELNHGDARRLFPYASAEDVFNEHRATTRGRDLDITGMSYALLDQAPQQWPLREGESTGAARLYADGVYPTPSGRARFALTDHKPTAEKTDARYPLHFNTGRLRDHWHGMTRTGRVPQLYGHVEEPLLAMNARDMRRRGLADGDIARVSSRRGEIAVRVAASADMRPGQTYLPMHWGSQFMNSPGANALTVPDFDPQSKQPELKHAAVRVDKLDLPWELVVMRAVSEADASALLAAAQPLLAEFGYAALGLFGRERPAVILRAANAVPAGEELVERIDRCFGFDPAASLSYADARRGVAKRVTVTDGRLAGVRLSGETAARDWLKQAVAEGMAIDTVRRWVLAPVSAPPAGSNARGRIVCNCHDVSESEISAEIASGADLGTLQAKLKCGTECGSCVPELKRLIAFKKAA